jgi:hypothetical protein
MGRYGWRNSEKKKNFLLLPTAVDCGGGSVRESAAAKRCSVE